MTNILKSSIMAYLLIDNFVETYNKPINGYNKVENVQEARERHNKPEIRVEQATNQ